MKHSDSEARLKGILETAIDGIITIFSNGKIESVNQAVIDLFGYEREEMIGQNISMLMPEPHRSQHDQYLNNYLSTGVKQIIGIGREVKGQRKEGELFDFYLSVSELKLGQSTLFTGLIHDISAIKGAEQRLKQLNETLEEKVVLRTNELTKTVNQLLTTKKALENEVLMRKQAEEGLKASKSELEGLLVKEKELSKLKSHFVTLASHEFRTPLTTVLSSATLIARYEDAEGQEKRLRHINKIRGAVQNLTAILDDFLSAGKLEEGKIAAQLAEVDLLPWLEEQLNSFRETHDASQEMALTFEKNCSTLLFKTDTRILQNVLLNLLSNATKYSRGKAEVFVTVALAADNEHMTLSVADKGIGIPVNEQQNLFERFFRASNSQDFKGTGLGLHIVKQYVELLGGSISIDSAENEGTTVLINLPI